MKGPEQGTLIAVVGAERTGKTQLAHDLARRLGERGLGVSVLEDIASAPSERLGWPLSFDELRVLAVEQARRMEQAQGLYPVVIADTTALTTAVCAQVRWGDASFLAQALASHRRVALTLLTPVDRPLSAQTVRTGVVPEAHRAEVYLRQALQQSYLAFSVVAGRSDVRLGQALRAVDHLLDEPQRRFSAAGRSSWRWYCEHCGDGDCEQQRASRVRAI